jgi:hypothetical protein
MASFRVHLATAAGLGVVYGGLAYWRLGIDPKLAAIGAGLTTIGGCPTWTATAACPTAPSFVWRARGRSF